MRTIVYILLSLGAFGLLVFLGSLFYAWLERRRWNRMSIAERLDEYTRRMKK